MNSPAQKYTNLGNITTPFGGQTAFEGKHPGVDIANKVGTKIHSPTDGVVVQTQNGQQQGSGWGNFVKVRDGDGNVHMYSHLHRGYVKPGDRVQKGKAIAEMGNTGGAYSKSGLGDGSHLDYRITDAFGRYINPSGYINNL